MSSTQISRGAEAIVFIENGIVVKRRLKKGYRIPEIDIELRKLRTRHESRLMERAITYGVSVPRVIDVNEQNYEIRMEFVSGDTVRDILSKENYKIIAKMIGSSVTLLHDANIIHGDLTTSNMILKDGKLFLIDFGLGFYSDKVEHKAVDLFLLKQALESKHPNIPVFEHVLSSYQANQKELILKRLDDVSKRRRYTSKN
ncbi:Kae1-associated kinase Bud32 [Nanoarchaeota archaeon]|nr:MAG: Kae1-associated kinase Bud32 [Nanoarchaeota archaeon]